MEELTRRGILASAAVAAWCWPRRDQAALPDAGGRFLLSSAAVADDAPLFATGFLDHDPALPGEPALRSDPLPPFAHCPSLAVLPDGRLACAWYAGSREGGKDVAILWAELAAADVAAGRCSWAAPRAVIDRATAARDLDRFVAKVGNSVIFTDDDARPWIVFVSIAVGGWSV